MTEMTAGAPPISGERSGGCLCGAVRYRSAGPWRPVVGCHCQTCRRISGHFWAATAVPRAAFVLTETAGLSWFRSSGFARRAFCNRCGATLFYEHDDAAHVSISAGSLDGATGLERIAEIFCDEKGDDYPLTAGIPHHPGDVGILPPDLPHLPVTGTPWNTE